MSWIEELPEPLREAPYLKAAESAEDALGKLQHAAKIVGTSMRIPGEDASDEDKMAFRNKLGEVDGVTILPTHDDIEGVVGLLNKLGYPEDHTGYSLPDVADFEWDEGMGEDLRKYAHKAGMTPGQFDAFARQIAEQEAGASAAANNELAEAQKALRADWGDTLEDRESLIRGWMEHSQAPAEMREMLDKRQFDLTSMNWLLSVAKQFEGEVNPINSDGKGNEPTFTPAEAKYEITKILTDMTNMSENDPRYPGLQKKLLDMQKLAMGSNAA